ncbi:peptide chain release factor 2 [Patescibacteria group bacterium]
MATLAKQIEELLARIKSTRDCLDLSQQKQKLLELQEQMTAAGFWDDQKKAQTVSREAARLEETLQLWEGLEKQSQDLQDISKLAEGEKDAELTKEAEEKLKELKKMFEEKEVEALLNEPYDQNNAIVALHAGTGGTDAQDWAEMLMRMYLRFADKEKLKISVAEVSSGEEAGIKSAVLHVKGDLAYGKLKAENGVHRLVRLSPFNADQLRQTSFALVEVLPEIGDVAEIEIQPDELRVDTYRASGKGGQHLNKTDSAVRITHMPTGLVAASQSERSQAQNKEQALTILRSKLHQKYEQEKQQEKQKIRGEYTEAVWGNQIRSYVLHPYKMVKDHRTKYETANAENVLDGDLGKFIEAYLRWRAKCAI